MTNETPSIDITKNPIIPFGIRLKSAREARGLEKKEAASQLRLNENIISMLETSNYPSHLPATFVRGYLRSYSKLLDIPDYEIKEALGSICLEPPKTASMPPITPPLKIAVNHAYLRSFFSYFLIIMLAGLLSIWWYNRLPSAPAATTLSITDTALALPQQLQPRYALTPFNAENAETAQAAAPNIQAGQAEEAPPSTEQKPQKPIAKSHLPANIPKYAIEMNNNTQE